MIYGECLEKVAERKPLIHCITNFVTVNDCANMILACGGRPTMAHHPGEAAEITSGSQALVLNMGTLHDVDSMLAAGRRSNELGHPVVLDPVGVGGSRLRRETFAQLADSVRFEAIRGNISELRQIATGHSGAVGVDACEAERITEQNVRAVADMAKKLSRRLDCVIAISGPLDVVAYKEQAVILRGGHPIMARVTGTGCMSTALMGTFLGANPDRPFMAAAAAAAVMKVCGTLAYQRTAKAEGGTMTFRMHLIDQVSLLTPARLDALVQEEWC